MFKKIIVILISILLMNSIVLAESNTVNNIAPVKPINTDVINQITTNALTVQEKTAANNEDIKRLTQQYFAAESQCALNELMSFYDNTVYYEGTTISRALLRKIKTHACNGTSNSRSNTIKDDNIVVSNTENNTIKTVEYDTDFVIYNTQKQEQLSGTTRVHLVIRIDIQPPKIIGETYKRLAFDIHKESPIVKSFPLLINENLIKKTFPLSIDLVKKYALQSDDTKYQNHQNFNEVRYFIDAKSNINTDADDYNAWLYATFEYTNGKAIVWGISYESSDGFYAKDEMVFLTTMSSQYGRQDIIKLIKISQVEGASETGVCDISEELIISCTNTDKNYTSQEDEKTTVAFSRYKINDHTPDEDNHFGEIELLEHKKMP